MLEPGLQSIGWPLDSPTPELAEGARLMRVIEQHRNGYTVHDGEHRHRAGAPRGLVPDDRQQLIRPAVGDWVAAVPETPWLLSALLPRRNTLARAAAGESFREQILAVNLDLAIVVMGLDGDYNPRRLERYLALIGSADIPAILVLSKADIGEQVPERVLEVQSLAGGRPVLAINCKDPEHVAPLAEQLGPGRTGILLGSSGAGKSTLSNTLLGELRQKTSDVRSHDSRGRHTTTVRSLLRLPTGGCLIDSPGMRELKLTGDEALESDQYADIQALGDACRFRNCRHQGEPGCAVLAAIGRGELEAERFQHFRKLGGERDDAVAQRAVQQRRADEKPANRAPSPRPTEKPPRR